MPADPRFSELEMVALVQGIGNIFEKIELKKKRILQKIVNTFDIPRLTNHWHDMR